MNIESILFNSKEKGARQVHDIIQNQRARCVFPMKEESFMKIMDLIFEKKAAFILDKTFWSGTKLQSCLMRPPEAAQRYRRSKGSIHPTSPYHVYGKGIDADLRNTLEDMNYRLFESGLHQDQHETRSTLDSAFFTEIATPTVRLCYLTFEDAKEFDAETVEPFGLKYVVFAFYLFCAGLVLAAIILFVIEPIHARVGESIKVKKGNRTSFIRINHVSIKSK